MTRRAVESDICIIGSGISAAMVAERLSRTTSASIVVVEAGDDTIPLERRPAMRERSLRYGENPWGRDHLEGYEIDGPLQSRSMQVGGLAMHWGGVTPRFSPEDFRQRSLFGVGTDWPISYEELDPFYQEAEELIGVAGEQGPPALDPRRKPFPMPAIPLTYNLELLKTWTTKAGIAMWSQPSAKNSIPGDPLPKLAFRDAPESVALRGPTEDSIRALFAEMAKAGGGTLRRTSVDNFQDHPAGGCRMGRDPSTSVVDAWGRTHDHANLFVAGAPTSVSGSCANATLTFCALALRSAHEMERAFPRRRTT